MRSLVYGFCAVMIGIQHTYATTDWQTDKSIRVQSFYSDSNRNLDKQNGGLFSAINLTANVDYQPLQLHADIIAASQQEKSQKFLSVQDREAFAGFNWDTGFIRVGRQIIPSGWADIFNPTDVLTPFNRTRMTFDDDLQRDGRMGIRVRQDWQDYSLHVMSFYDHRYQVLPLPDIGLNILEDQQKRDAYALRLDYSGQNLQAGVMYYTGADLQPAFDLSRLGLGIIQQTHLDYQLVGVDATGALKGIAWRAEAACDQLKQESTITTWVRQPQCQLAVGGDYTLGKTYLLAQLTYLKVRDWQVPANDSETLFSILLGQHQPEETIFTLKASYNWRNDSIQTELPCSFGLRASNWACRPRIHWAVQDSLKFTLGADVFKGTDKGYLGRLKENTMLLVGVELQH